MKRVFGFCCFLLAASFASAREGRLTLLHFSDLHGHLENFPRLVTLAKTTGADYIFLAGDLFMGTPISSEWRGAVEVEAMRRLGLDAMAVGNHEFDFTLPRLLALRRRMTFPLIGANVLDRRSGKPLFPPLHFLNHEGDSVVLLGLITPLTPILTYPDNVRTLDFLDPVVAARQHLPEIEAADLRIALTHMEEEFDEGLLKKIKVIDLVLAGHTHPDPQQKDYCRKVRRRWLCRTPAYGKFIGRIDLEKSKKRWRLTDARLIALDASLPEDKAAKQWVAGYEREIDRRYSRVVATATEDLVHHREGPTPLGRLIAQVMKEHTSADVALINSGGIRTSFKKGPIRLKDVITALPFGNTLQVLELTGKELNAVLKFSEKKKHSGGYLQTAGVEGRKFRSKEKLKVCTIDFLVAGGDGYHHFKDKKIVQSYSKTIGEVVAGYLKDQHTIPVTE